MPVKSKAWVVYYPATPEHGVEAWLNTRTPFETKAIGCLWGAEFFGAKDTARKAGRNYQEQTRGRVWELRPVLLTMGPL